jgi:hypothetical protein
VPTERSRAPARKLPRKISQEDLTAIVKYIERDAGFEIPKTR